MREPFLIVDGNSLIFRAFHAMPLLNVGGTYANAIFGFLTMLFKAVEQEKAKHVVICFDEHGPTFRHLRYPEYKAGRSPTPPELIQQLATIRTLLDEMGLRWYGVQGWEADDLLGTFARQGIEAGLSPMLLTGDRDALQLVNADTTLIFTRKGITETVHFTPETVLSEYGFTPEQVTDWKGLAGDSSDNIPGVPGVGDKTAVKLLQAYGSLEEVLAHADGIKGKLGEKLRANADLARQCKELATIRTNAPVTLDPAAVLLPDAERMIPALAKLNLNSIIARIKALLPNGDTAEAAPEKPAFPIEEAAVLADLSAFRAFLSDTQEADRPLAFAVDDAGASVCGASGRNGALTLGGDLLTPGIDPVDCLRLLAEEMRQHPAVVHDGKQLLHRFRDAGCDLPDSFAWDVTLGGYLLNPQEKSYALAALCGDLPADARGVQALYQRQKPLLTEQNMLRLLQEVELPLQHTLFRMEDAGFTVDTAFLRELGARYAEEIEACRREVIAACGGEEFNLNSTQQLGEVLFGKLQLPHGKKTKHGYSTNAEVLESLQDIAPEIIVPLLRYRQLTKLNSTYVEGLQRVTDASGRVHSTFDQVATATGRISSSEPNLQNIPIRKEDGREIRRAFLPRPGWVLLDADYSQIELRLMAHFSGDEAMLDAFRSGQDIHARTASQIFEVPLDQVTPELRSRAKAVNFGLIYGISAFGLARNTGVTPKEAQDFITRYFAKYPGVKRFMDQSASDGAQHGFAETLMGRRRYLPELQSRSQPVREFGKRAAMNTPVQGTAADIIKLAMVRVDRALANEGLQSRLILQVHDELLLECPPEEASRAAELLQQAMEQVVKLQVPLVAEVHSGANWAEAK